MDTEYLLKRRAAIVGRHEILESVPGSGWHQDDARAREERIRGFVALTARPVALQNDAEFYFVGPCVGIVREALAKFAADYERDRAAEQKVAEESKTEPPEILAQHKHAYHTARRFVESDGDTLLLHAQQFNGILYALNSLKISVVCAGVVA